MTFIYKIVPRPLWEQACAAGVLTGAPVDHADGFIHFSTAAQLAATANKHFRGQRDLLLVRVPAHRLGERLRYEPARGNELFPHLYGVLPVHVADKVTPCEAGADGLFSFTEL